MSEQNKQLARRSLEFWASGNSDDADEVFSPSYVNHQEPSIEGDVKDLGLQEWKALVAGYHAAFSQSQVRILMQIVEDDLIATRWEFTARNTGDYAGHAPTGKTAVWTGIQIDRVRDGRIVESWIDWDKYRLLETLGLL